MFAFLKMDSHRLALFFTMVVGLAFADSFVQVYRYGVTDVFQNPSYPNVSTINDCVANATSCREYKAHCLADGYCCLCICSPKFSTYSVIKRQCLADSVWLSGKLLVFVSFSFSLIVYMHAIFTVAKHIEIPLHGNHSQYRFVNSSHTHTHTHTHTHVHIRDVKI